MCKYNALAVKHFKTNISQDIIKLSHEKIKKLIAVINQEVVI